MNTSDLVPRTNENENIRSLQIGIFRDLKFWLRTNAAKSTNSLLDGPNHDPEVAVEQLPSECLTELFWGLDFSGEGPAAEDLRQYLSVVWSKYEGLWMRMKAGAENLLERCGLNWDNATLVFSKLDYSEPREKIFNLISEEAFQVLLNLQGKARCTIIPGPVFDAATEYWLSTNMFRPGLAGYDLYLVHRIARRASKDKAISEEMEASAVRAARRLAAGYFSQPIYKKKMDSDSRFWQELRTLADTEGEDVTSTLRHLTETSLFLTADVPSPGSFTKHLRAVGNELDRLVTEDLLNRPYSKRFREEQSDSHLSDEITSETDDDTNDVGNTRSSGIQDDRLDLSAHLDARISLQQMAVTSELTNRQFALLVATMEYRTMKQESERLGISPDHARQELRRAREKIKRNFNRGKL